MQNQPTLCLSSTSSTSVHGPGTQSDTDRTCLVCELLRNLAALYFVVVDLYSRTHGSLALGRSRATLIGNYKMWHYSLWITHH